MKKPLIKVITGIVDAIPRHGASIYIDGEFFIHKSGETEAEECSQTVPESIPQLEVLQVSRSGSSSTIRFNTV